MDSELLELKARVSSFDTVRTQLRNLKAVAVGTFRQVDTYYCSPKDRLKLREVPGDTAQLIFYSREDNSGPKRCKALVIEVQDPQPFKALFEQMLGRRVVVDKVREIYTYEGTQIHLDTVQNLGTFIEFERRTLDLAEDYTVLDELMTSLLIKPRDLIQGSYSDLLTQ